MVMNKLLAISAIAITAAFVIGFYGVGAITTQHKPGCYANPNGECSTKDLALCLADKGIKFYGTYWCGHCANQKSMFGVGAEYLPYIECDLGQGRNQSIQNPECKNAGVNAFPTWVINGVKYEGEQPLSKLGEVSGCFEYG